MGRIRFSGEGFQLDGIAFRGRLVWLARLVGEQLGYSQRGGRLVTKLSEGPWRRELVEGRDVFKVLNEDAQALHLEFGWNRGMVTKIRSAVLLTASGVDMVCILSRRPEARPMRQWFLGAMNTYRQALRQAPELSTS